MAATIITNLTTVSDLNNHGVQCINNGDFNGALSHFRKALAVAVAAKNLSEAETTSKTAGLATCIPSLTLPQPMGACKNEENDEQDSRPSKRMKSNTTPNAFSSFRHSTGHNYRAAEVSSSCEVDKDTLLPQGIIMAPSSSVIFSISSKLTRFSSIQNQSISSAIIMFNIGLVYHLVGRQGFGSLRHLQTAISMYQNCHDLLSASCAFCSTGNSTLDLLAMALFHNMAHIHHNDLVDFPKVKNYSEQLVRFATCIVTSRYENRNQVMQIKHAICDFLCNVMMIRNATRVAAAA